MDNVNAIYSAVYDLGYRGWLGLLKAKRDGLITASEFDAIKTAAGGIPTADVVRAVVWAS